MSSALLRSSMDRLGRAARATKRRASAGLDVCWPSEVALALQSWPGWEPDEADGYCHRCGVSAGPGAVTANGCSFCRGKRQPWQRVTRLSAYTEPMDGWIKAMKFGGQWSWSRWLGAQLAERVGEPIDPARVIVAPVPMHWARRWRRGFNQAHLIALSLAEQRGWRCGRLLKRTRHTHPQTAVVHSDRQANVRDSVAALAVDLTGWQVVLVDDVKTTGATAGLCCRLLKQAGATSIHLAVAAVADPQSVKAKEAGS